MIDGLSGKAPPQLLSGRSELGPALPIVPESALLVLMSVWCLFSIPWPPTPGHLLLALLLVLTLLLLSLCSHTAMRVTRSDLVLGSTPRLCLCSHAAHPGFPTVPWQPVCGAQQAAAGILQGILSYGRLRESQAHAAERS